MSEFDNTGLNDIINSMVDLSLSPRSYDLQSATDISKRLDKYNEVVRYLDEIDFCECQNYKIRKLDAGPVSSPFASSICPEIDIISQIGSDSVDGLVYKITIGGTEAAMKVMPIFNTELLERNNNEVQIARICSSLVVSGQSVNFPIVYGSYSCKNIKYKNDSPFLNLSVKYEIANYLFDLVQRNVKTNPRNKIKLRNLKSYLNDGDLNLENMMDVLNEALSRSGLDAEFQHIEEDDAFVPHLQGNLLISEMAHADIINYSVKSILEGTVLPNRKWLDIIGGVLTGINNLQQNNICHNDLHPGNVLILLDTHMDRLIPLIHDFGHSIISESWSSGGYETRSTDIVVFLDKLLRYETKEVKPGTSEPAKITDAMTPEMMDLLERLLSSINTLSSEPIHESPDFMNNVIAIFETEKAQMQREGGRVYKNKRATKRWKGRNRRSTKRKRRSRRNKVTYL